MVRRTEGRQPRQIVGYVALSTGLEYCWYHRLRHRRAEWKTQPGKDAAATTTHERWVWGLPALDLLFSDRQTHFRCGLFVR
jgi:hypothetical protein